MGALVATLDDVVDSGRRMVREDWIGPGYDRSRPLVSGMHSTGVGNRIGGVLDWIAAAEALKRPTYFVWNVAAAVPPTSRSDVLDEMHFWQALAEYWQDPIEYFFLLFPTFSYFFLLFPTFSYLFILFH